jgi:hypothetical protein
MSVADVVALAQLGLTAVATVVVIVGAYLGLRQLSENARLRQVEVMGRVFEYVAAPDVRAARKRARTLKMPDDMSLLTPQQVDDIEMVLIRWAWVGILHSQGVFGRGDEDLLFSAFAGSIDNSWQHLKGYVAYQRSVTGTPDYFSNAERLAVAAREWRLRRHLPLWKDLSVQDVERRPAESGGEHGGVDGPPAAGTAVRTE